MILSPGLLPQLVPQKMALVSDCRHDDAAMVGHVWAPTRPGSLGLFGLFGSARIRLEIASPVDAKHRRALLSVKVLGLAISLILARGSDGQCSATHKQRK